MTWKHALPTRMLYYHVRFRTEGISLPFKKMVPTNSTSIPLATCPIKKLLNMVVKEFKLDSPSVFNISNIIPDGPLIFHFSYHSLHTTYSTSILWTTPTSLSINVDPHLFSTFISLSVFSIQICFRSFTNLHHVIFIFKTGYPNNITLFPWSLFCNSK